MPLRVRKQGKKYRLVEPDGGALPAKFPSRARAEAARSAINIAKARRAGHRIPRRSGS